MGCKQLNIYDFFRLENAEKNEKLDMRFCGDIKKNVYRNFSKATLDQYGRLSKITDPKVRATTFAYDALGRQLSRTLPMGQSESQSYNTLGQLASKTDFKGVLTEFTYDNFGRTEYKTHSFGGSSETIQFTYDTLGRQNEIIEARGTTTYSYDNFSRMTKISTPEGDVNYEYDSVTSRKTRAYSANTDTSYSYDTLGRLATVTDSNGATTYNYTKVGSRSDVTLPNGAKTVYQYDNLNRLTNLTNKNSSNDILSSYTYSLAPNGRRTAVAEQTLKDDNLTFSTRNIAYTYDGLNRLTKEVSECADNAELQFTDEYTYDLVGNRTQKVHTADVNETIGYTFNNNDQLTLESSNANGDTVYSYDANGSQIGKVGQNSSYIYSYNLQNRLSTATITRTETEPMGVSKLVDITSSYIYNQSGIRVGANTSTTIDGGMAEIKDTVYLTDPANFTGYSQVIEESTNGTLTKSYTLGDDVLAQTVGATISYLQYDGHGSTRLLTNDSSAIANRFDYDAYGKNLFSANVTNPSATDMLYSGEQFDPNLQMQYLRARYYDQDNGRFNRLDDYMGNNSDPQSLHKYAYCHGNPVMGIDPSGMMTMVGLQGAMGIIMTVASNYMYVTGETLKAIKSRFGKSAAINMALAVIQVYQYVEIAILAIMAIYVIAKIAVNIPNIYRFFVNLFKKAPEMIRKIKGFFGSGVSRGTNLFHTTHGVKGAEAAQGVLNGINPDFLSPDARFGRAFYMSDDAVTTLAELSSHGKKATHTIRFNFSSTSANTLDLTNPATAKAWGYSGGSITNATQAIGPKASTSGYNVIKFSSTQGSGINYAILDDFAELLTPKMIVPTP